MPQEKKLGIAGLTGIVLGSMIGAGIFNIAQTMSAGAALGGTLIAWAVTGVGMGLLVWVFKTLSEARPDLNSGIYEYAREVGGDYLGFNIAWGYWLSVAVSIVAFAVMFNDSLGAFFPVLLRHGWPTLLIGLGIIWFMCGLVMVGINTAAWINTAMTFLKFLLLVLMLGVLAISAKVGALKADFWGNAMHLGGLGSQIKNDMLVSLWCFIGVEGAVMMASRAKKRKDVGRAGMIGFFLAWVCYILINALCFGIMSQPEMAKLPNPSMAYVLRAAVGEWAYWFVIISVVFSLMGCWISWTLVCAQTPYGAASVKLLPSRFLRVTKRDVPHYSLIASCILMTIFLIMVCLSDSLYMASVRLTSIMVLPAYFFSALYMLRILHRKDQRKPLTMAAGWLALIFTIWMVVAGGLALLLFSAVFYVAGTWFYLIARREHFPQYGTRFATILTLRDRWIFCLLCLATVCGGVLIACGYRPF